MNYHKYYCDECGGLWSGGEFEQHQLTVPILCNRCYVKLWNQQRWPAESYGRDPGAPPDGYAACDYCAGFYSETFHGMPPRSCPECGR